MKGYGHRIFKIFFFVIFAFVSFTLISYAWSTDTYTYNQELMGKSRKSYFAGGIGTSENPFIISDPVHMFNFSYLQNEGIFDTVPSNWPTNGFYEYNFKLGEIIGEETSTDTFGNIIPIVQPTVIDFATDPFNQTLPPAGTEDHPFNCVFEGNNSVIKNYIIDGNYYSGIELQDIGTFGYVGVDAVIQNLYIKNPTILSNPSSTYDRSGYHIHNDDNQNIATGYLAGHVEGDETTSPTLLDIYIATNPETISSTTYKTTLSSSNSYAENRTQYGFIGYTAANLGEIPGGPQDQMYNFDLNAQDTEDFLIYALQNYGSWYVNNTTTLLSNVLTYRPGISSGEMMMAAGYSLSTIQISQTQFGTTYNMYNYVTEQALQATPSVDVRIGSVDYGYYNIENINLAGQLVLGYDSSSGVREFIFTTAPTFSPLTSGTFNPRNYPNVIILYVKPTTDPNDLGQITYTYVGAQGIVLLNPAQIALGSSGTSHTLTTSESYCAVVKDPQTGELTVVNPANETPDYYVFMIAAKNGNTRIQDLYFQYTPVEVTTDALSSISNMAFIYDVADGDDVYASGEFQGDPIAIGTILSSAGVPDPAQENNNLTYFNFSYELNNLQQMVVDMSKLSYDVNNSYFDYSLNFSNVNVASSFISIFIVNIHNDNIYLNLNGTAYNTVPYTNDIIIVTIEYNGSSNYISQVDTTDYS